MRRTRRTANPLVRIQNRGTKINSLNVPPTRNDLTQADVTTDVALNVAPAVVKIGLRDRILALTRDHHMVDQVADVTNKMDLHLAALVGDQKDDRAILDHNVTVAEAIVAQTLDLHPVDLVVVEMNKQGHHNAALMDDQKGDPEISDHNVISPAETVVPILVHHPVDQVKARMTIQDHHLADQWDDAANSARLTNSPAEIMVVTSVHHPAHPVVAEMTMQGHRLADQSVELVISDLLTNSPAEIMVVTLVHHPADPVVAEMNMRDHHLADLSVDVANLARHRADLAADGVNTLDDYRMVLVGDPKDDLALSDLLANELAEIVVLTLAHFPAAPVVDEVI